MDFKELSKIQPSSCLNCQDENNNFSNSICSSHQHRGCLEKENDQIIVVSDINSDDEPWRSSCSLMNESELISLDTEKLWDDIAHIMKCIYRETNKEFAENHSSDAICQAKGYVQILTQINAESLFNKIELIVLEYVNEIRKQVLKRFQTCSKTSSDVQLFISYLLDEYNSFIQSAKNAATIIYYLEEKYMKSIDLTWLLYNKHLYEKLVYMDKKIHHSMSLMIDLLEPSNDNNKVCSPAEYAQLLNRFLAFDEEMSEISCLYKDCQKNISLQTKPKAVCKEKHTIKNIHQLTKEVLNSSTAAKTSKDFVHDSPICASKASSCMISTREIQAEETKLSSSHNKEELGCLTHDTNNRHEIHNTEQLCLDNLTYSSSMIPNRCENVQLELNTNVLVHENEENIKKLSTNCNINDQQDVLNVTSIKSSQSNKPSSNDRNESPITNLNTLSLSTASPIPSINLQLKPPSSIVTKLAADFRPLTMPQLNKTETPTCPSLLSAKIQSVSFTAGTFGSLTTNKPIDACSNNRKTLSISLSRKQVSSIATDLSISNHNRDQLLGHAETTNDFSTLLSPISASKQNDDNQTSSFNDKDYDFCCCDFHSESDSSTTNSSATCMSLPIAISAIPPYACNQRDIDMKERLKLKLTKRCVEDYEAQAQSKKGHKSNVKPCDNNIDALVKFIDGNEMVSDKPTSKKTKKKKTKQTKLNPCSKDSNENQTSISSTENLNTYTPTRASKRKRKIKLNFEEEQKQDNESSATAFTTRPVVVSSGKLDSTQSNENILTEDSLPKEVQEEEEEEEQVNWITISRKQSKPKVKSVPAQSSLAKCAAPSYNAKQKQSTSGDKTKTINVSVVAQRKVVSETERHRKIQQHSTVVVPSIAPNPVPGHTLPKQLQKVMPSSVWISHEQAPVKSSSTLLATAPAFFPSCQVKQEKMNDVFLLPEPRSSTCLNSNNNLLSSDSVQQSRTMFSPAPSFSNTLTSRCIQRPASDAIHNFFPVYSSMNDNVDTLTSACNDKPIIDSKESLWQYPDQQNYQTSNIPNDFPLYDPFNSGTGLPLMSSAICSNCSEEPVNDLYTLQSNPVDDTDILNKEIEYFKKFYIDNVAIDSSEQIQIQNDHSFIHHL